MEKLSYQTPGLSEPTGRRRILLLVIGATVMALMGVGAWFIIGRWPDTKASQNVLSGTSGSVIPPIQKGLTPEEEKKYGTDPNEFDTDGDGLSDYNEIKVWKTDPKKVDTDGDDFGDGYEVVNGYNPAGAGKLK